MHRKQKSCFVVIKLLQQERDLQNFGFSIFCVRVHYIELLKDIPKFKMGHLNENSFYFLSCFLVKTVKYSR